jgi:hypothetical protein
MSEYTTFEKIGIRNEVNKILCPFIEQIERVVVELRLSLDREEPNVVMGLRRVEEMGKLVGKLELNRKKWNQEF